MNHELPRPVALLALLPLFACGGGPGGDPSKGSNRQGDSSAPADTAAPVDTAGVALRGPGGESVAQGATLDVLEFDGIPPWSFGAITLEVVNSGGDDTTIEGISLDGVGETESVEWSLTQPGALSVLPFDPAGAVLAPGDTLPFGVYFRPVYSGDRDVRVRVRHSAGADAEIVVHGRGRDNAVKSPVLASRSEWVFGRSNAAASNDFQPGALLVDLSGDLFLTGNVNGWGDGFSENLAVASIGEDGGLRWLYEWNEPYEQLSHDVGDNGELGGSAHSAALDAAGDLYLAARRSQSSSNNVFQALVINVDGDTGQVGWATGVTGGSSSVPTLASENLQATALDASLPGRVLVAGKVADSGGMLLMALDSADGSLLWVRSIVSSGTSRAGALTVHDGAAYVGGVANNKAFIARVDGVSGASPSLAWSKNYGSYGVVRALDIAGDTMLVGIERRGLPTRFVGAALDPADGSVRWAKVWDADHAGDTNNSLIARIIGGEAVIGGRVAIEPFDTQGGEGFVMRLDLADGAWRDGSFFYNGKGAEEMTWHHVSAIAEGPDGHLWAVSQATPGSLNQQHFWGRWYQATDNATDFPAGDGGGRLADDDLSPASVSASLLDLPGATAHDVDTAAIWTDASEELVLQDSLSAEEEGVRLGVHALLQRLVPPDEVDGGGGGGSGGGGSGDSGDSGDSGGDSGGSGGTTGDDYLEDNDSIATATAVDGSSGPVIYSGLMALDDDYFAVDVCSGGTLDIAIDFRHAAGDLDLELLDAAGAVLLDSAGVTDREQVSWGPLSAVATLYVRVFGYGGATNTYDLSLTVTGC